KARGVVVATGGRTELGRINRMLAGIENVTTPLLRRINAFGRTLAIVILVGAAVTFLFGTQLRGIPPADMFLMVVALVASAIPEGLPAIMASTLALGVQRMARRNAVVRRLPAVETLGSVTVICSDKTGTLTRNEMTVKRLVCAGCTVEVEGVGYEPVGGLKLSEREAAQRHDDIVAMALRVGLLCNDARLREEEGDWRIEGDPTEGALIVVARKAGMDEA